MGNDETVTAVLCVPARSAPRHDERSLAGLIDVLDRADAMLPRHRSRPRRSAAYRPAGRRVPTPVRPVPAPPAGRALPAPAPRTVAAPPSAHGVRARLHAVVRRLALWGAGPDGAYLAWGGPRPSRLDPPVVLTELPSTPTVSTPPSRPAVSSPTAALFP